ncbi:MAG: ABC transporter permease [Candidatus Krumholzibacteriota bacterium]
MRRILHLAMHDTRLFLLARENFFFMLVMPVMFMLFFSSVLGGGGGPTDVQVSLQVVNEDTGFMGDIFLEQLRGEEFDVELVTAAEADTTYYIRRLVIPADFTGKVLAAEKVQLDFTKQSNSSIEYDAAADVRLHQAQVAFLGGLIRWEHQTGAAVTAADEARLRKLIADPPRVTVTESFAGTGRPVASGAGQSIAGMLTMFMIMTVLIGGTQSLTAEKLHGTLARLATTPMSRGEIIQGKLLHLGMVGFVQAMVLMIAGELIGVVGLFGIEFTWGPYWWVVALFIIPFSFAVSGLTLLIGGLFRTTQQAEALGWLFGMIFSALGGCWWPLEIMPRTAQIIGWFTPTYWSMTALHGVVTFGKGLDAIVGPALIVTAFGLLFAWLGARTLRVVN